MSCALCSNDISHQPILDGNHTFCCHGCHAVFNILSTQNRLDRFQEHPVFQQALRSGLISNPALLEQIRKNKLDIPKNQLQKLYLEVNDMWCPSCAEVIKLFLLQEAGVRNCVIDYATDLASIEFSPMYLSKESILKRIESLGYRPTTLETSSVAVNLDLNLRFLVAAFCALNIMMFASPLYASYISYDFTDYGSLFTWLSLGSVLPVMGYSAIPIMKRFWNSFKIGIYGMETLVVMGMITAFTLSVYNMYHHHYAVYFDSLAVIVTLVLLGKIIENKAKFSAKDAMRRLVYALPRRGRKQLANGSFTFVSIKEIAQGDILRVLSGEKIVCDGMVLEGEGLVDESLMTGEMIPINKNMASLLIGGSILQQGSLTYRITRDAESSTLHKIVDMVQQELGTKSAYVRAADPIVRWFVPFVLMLALLTGIGCLMWGLGSETAVTRAMAVMLISCPCAIGIAAPLAESQLMNGMAALGAIVRNRGVLTHLGRVTTYVFDKTGTLTEGQFRILHGIEMVTDMQRKLLKGLASHSNHLISRAITAAISDNAIALERVEEIIGRGVRGVYDGQALYLGSQAFLESHGIACPSISTTVHDIVHTVVYFAVCNTCVATIVLGDRIREGAEHVISELGKHRVVLLSGDSETAVQAAAELCGITQWKSGCTPLEKRMYIEALRQRGEVVCMVGDGINDAPALTAADIGISVVSATDLSIQVSDVLLTTDCLQVLPKICWLARKGYRIINQNLFWAFFYNVMGIGLAMGGMLTPIFAALAMMISSLMVIFNAKRTLWT